MRTGQGWEISLRASSQVPAFRCQTCPTHYPLSAWEVPLIEAAVFADGEHEAECDAVVAVQR